MSATHPFNTEKPLSAQEKATYDAIDARLKELSPRIDIKDYIGLELTPRKDSYSSLKAHKSTLDGINFRTDRVKALEHALHSAKDRKGNLHLPV